MPPKPLVAPPPKFSPRQQAIQSLAAMTSAALGAVCGSFFSTAGTFYGAVLGTAAFGSLVSGTAHAGMERLLAMRRSPGQWRDLVLCLAVEAAAREDRRAA